VFQVLEPAAFFQNLVAATVWEAAPHAASDKTTIEIRCEFIEHLDCQICSLHVAD
jgi:hypothetical protein